MTKTDIEQILDEYGDQWHDLSALFILQLDIQIASLLRLDRIAIALESSQGSHDDYEYKHAYNYDPPSWRGFNSQNVVGLRATGYELHEAKAGSEGAVYLMRRKISPDNLACIIPSDCAVCDINPCSTLDDSGIELPENLRHLRIDQPAPDQEGGQR